MASTPPTSQRASVIPAKSKTSEERGTRKIRVAEDDAVKAEVLRFARDHRELVEDLAK